MANQDIVLIQLQETLTNLEASNPILGNGQKVIATSISNSVHNISKIGDGISTFNTLSFTETLKIETSSNYDLTQSWLSIDGNEVEITALADIIITTDTDPIDLLNGQTMKLRYIASSWVTVAAGSGASQVDGTLGTTINDNILVYFDTSGVLQIGDNRELSKAILSGFLVKSGISGDKRQVQTGGILDNFTGLSTGKQYFLGYDGSVLLKGSINYNEYIVSVGVAISATEIDVNISMLEPNRNYDDGIQIGGIISFATYKDRSAQGYKAFDFDNAISQANYPILFAEIGHKFNEAHVAAGDPDLSSSSTSFYPTPPPSYYERAGVPDSASLDSTSDISTVDDVINNLSTYEKFKHFKNYTDSYNGVPVRFKLTSGSLPVSTPQIVEDTTYYLRFGTSPAFQIYTIESEAIAPGTKIDFTATATGTFVLTQEGIALDDAFQGHFMRIPLNGAAVSAGAFIPQSAGGGASNRTTDLIVTDGINGTPRTSNETRPKTAIMFKYIKAEYVTTAGEPISALREHWERGDSTTWNNQIITVTMNNIVSPIKDLHIKVEIQSSTIFSSPDWQEVKSLFLDRTTPIQIDAGLSIKDTGSQTSFQLVTGKDGIPGLILDGSGNLNNLWDGFTGNIRCNNQNDRSSNSL